MFKAQILSIRHEKIENFVGQSQKIVFFFNLKLHGKITNCLSALAYFVRLLGEINREFHWLSTKQIVNCVNRVRKFANFVDQILKTEVRLMICPSGSEKPQILPMRREKIVSFVLNCAEKIVKFSSAAEKLPVLFVYHEKINYEFRWSTVKKSQISSIGWAKIASFVDVEPQILSIKRRKIISFVVNRAKKLQIVHLLRENCLFYLFISRKDRKFHWSKAEK